MLKFSKDLEWTEPFVNSVRHLVPLHTLDSIKVYSVPFGKEESSAGWCTRKGRRFTISLRSTNQVRSGKKQCYKARTIEDILLTLAHELTHLVHWDYHGPSFANLYATVIGVMFSELSRYGIRDIQQRHDIFRKNKK